MLPVLIVLIAIELTIGNVMRHKSGGMSLVHVLWSITIAMHQVLPMHLINTPAWVFCMSLYANDLGDADSVHEYHKHHAERVRLRRWSDGKM